MAGRWSILTSLGFCLAICAALVYAGEKDFWSSKPYTQWTEKEVDKMLKNSPWAKEITLSGAQSAPTEGVGGGGEMASGGEGGGGGGGGRSGRGGNSEANLGQQGLSLPTIIVRWYARPVREALAQRFLLGTEPSSKDTIDRLLKFDIPFYSLLIEGWSAGGGRGGRGERSEATQQLRQETYLRKKNKQKLPVAEVVMPTARGQSLVLRFAKEQDGRPTLTLDDKEVELVIKVRDNTYHIKFKLADMVIKNQLEL